MQEIVFHVLFIVVWIREADRLPFVLTQAINQFWYWDQVKPGSYFLRMRSEFDVNLTSQLSFRSDIRKWVERSWTAANIRCEFCDVNIRFAFAFAGSMNRALILFVLAPSSYYPPDC